MSVNAVIMMREINLGTERALSAQDRKRREGKGREGKGRAGAQDGGRADQGSQGHTPFLCPSSGVYFMFLNVERKMPRFCFDRPLCVFFLEPFVRQY